jgi:hypothetical protein
MSIIGDSQRQSQTGHHLPGSLELKSQSKEGYKVEFKNDSIL